MEAEGAAIAEDAVRAMEGLPPAARPGMWWWTSDVVEITREVLVFPGTRRWLPSPSGVRG